MSKLSNQLSGQCQKGLKVYAKGGAVKHDDVKEDKALIAKELKARGLKCGGKAKKGGK